MKKACCTAAPVVMQFDPSGRLLQSWDGPGDGYEWPLPNNEHGIFVDHKIEGKFVKEAFVRRGSAESAGTVSSLAFSPGPDTSMSDQRKT